jgi:hypothetical protein
LIWINISVAIAMKAVASKQWIRPHVDPVLAV